MRVTTIVSGVLIGFAAVAFLPACAVFGRNKTPEPDYDVVLENDDIEVRRYAPMLLAQTTVEGGDFDESSSAGFRRLFKYITGENTSADKIPMTAPVLQEQSGGKKDGQKIPMTAPVLQQETSANSWDVAFVLPPDFTMETAPRPTNPQVTLVQKEARHVAAIVFSGGRKESRYAEHATQLETWLTDHGYELLSEPRYAGYDAPFTLPMFRRNEVLIDVKPPQD